ncbi:MAG TPA: DNA-directed RNA polymerase subunit omega [Clostridiaceae bacterium]|nr:DNA-directed RNA polymerase subunit omega [Clostridiaceae bacterium]
MLNQPPLEKLLPKAENRYILAMLAAKRARQLVDGANPLVESRHPNPVTVACEEIVDDMVKYRHGRYDPFVPLRPEIEARLLAEELEDQEKRAAELAEETRRMMERDVRLGINDSEVAEELGGESFTADDAAALARQLILAVEVQDEADRLEAARLAEEAGNAVESAVEDSGNAEEAEAEEAGNAVESAVEDSGNVEEPEAEVVDHNESDTDEQSDQAESSTEE